MENIEAKTNEEELSDWQKEILDSREHLFSKPEAWISLEDFLKEMDEETDNED